MVDQSTHDKWGAVWTLVNGVKTPLHFGDFNAEYRALRETVAVTDLSARSRLCLVGKDRTKFLHGQVTNDILSLKEGQGCYAAIVNSKAKMESDANVWVLHEELLMDMEPGLTEHILQRLEKFIIADDVQVVDATSLYSQLALQGPLVDAAIRLLDLEIPLPLVSGSMTKTDHPVFGEIYLASLNRFGCPSFDLFVPASSFTEVLKRVVKIVEQLGGKLAGWQAWETLRIEQGVPRYGLDMDSTTLPPEAGLEGRAISYSKGCYTGQEIIARIRTYGQVAKSLRGLRFENNNAAVPEQGTKLFSGDREVGFVTSALISPALGAPLALGYVRREANPIGTKLVIRSGLTESVVIVTALDSLTKL